MNFLWPHRFSHSLLRSSFHPAQVLSRSGNVVIRNKNCSFFCLAGHTTPLLRRWEGGKNSPKFSQLHFWILLHIKGVLLSLFCGVGIKWVQRGSQNPLHWGTISLFCATSSAGDTLQGFGHLLRVPWGRREKVEGGKTQRGQFILLDRVTSPGEVRRYKYLSFTLSIVEEAFL